MLNNNPHPYIFDAKTQCWMRPDYASIDYSDGNETEERIKSIVEACVDRSVLSDELRSQCVDWPTAYHLSGTRSNILRPFSEALAGARVLEIGAGCGAITRFLGEAGADVLALEGSVRRASIARARTRDLPMVTVLAESFADFELDAHFDCVTLIGVLEYANLFVPGENPTLEMLRRARRLLKKDGVLIVAIENQLGLKYFAGAPEDHIWKTMYGVEERYRANEPKTFGASELMQIMRAADFTEIDRFAPFPDYKFPYAIVTESGAHCARFDAAALASQHARRDQQMPSELAFAPERVWPEVGKNELLLELSNSLLYVASSSARRLVDGAVLAFNYSTERQSRYCKQALFSLHDDDGIVVHHTRLDREGSTVESQDVRWHFSEDQQEPYYGGALLQSHLVDCWKTDGWMLSDIASLLKLYLDELLKSAGLQSSQITLDIQLPGRLIDFTPSNLIFSDSGIRSFDQEWELNREISLGWVLFRSFLIAMQSVTRIGRYAQTESLSRDELMKLMFQAVDLPVTDAELQEYAELEAQFQRKVTLRNSDGPVDWYAQSKIPHLNAFELLWTSRRDLASSRDELASSEKNLALTRQALASSQEDVRNHERKIVDLNQAINRQFVEFESLDKKLALERHELKGAGEELRRLKDIEQRYAELGIYKRLNSALESQISSLANNFRTLRPIPKNRSGWRSLVPDRFKAKDEALEVDVAYLHSSPAFDSDYYLSTYPDLPFASRLDAARHFHTFGWKENRRPAIWFDCEAYLLANPDVLVANIDPFLHFLRNGISETRRLRHAIHFTQNRSLDIPVHDIGPVFPDPNLPESAGAKTVRASVRIYVNQAESQHFDRCKRIALACTELGLHCSIGLPAGTDQNALAIEPSSHILISDFALGDDQWLDFLSTQSVTAEEFDVLASIATADFEGDGDHGLLPQPALSKAILQAIHLSAEQCALLRTGLPFCTEFDAENNKIPAETMHNTYVQTVENPEGVTVPEDLSLGSAFFVNARFHKHYLRHRGDLVHFARHRSLESRVLFLVTARSRDFRSAYLMEQAVSQKSVWYETQGDFRSTQKQYPTKVLAFYLPQFRPTPENDVWHGKGFTEWYKVRSASPLFNGHYQQHVPHADLGYYSIEECSILEKQAQMLKTAGMHGLVFYHYWFSGRLILEKAAQILLANPQVDLPFCFCWANENWTKRWDGEDQEVLLAQNYSREDAKAFIEYLIPFFRDSRYIKVNNRPMLIVYRPSSMEMSTEYVSIWKEVCLQHGLEEPYVVATLTRGATSPEPYGMDAALERPLNDWTDGAVPDIRADLPTYSTLNGSVLDYSKVADFYSKKEVATDFTYLRSVVPVWDNTPRYKSAAYLLHDYSNLKFQQWLDSALRDSSIRLPEEEQFLVINAWNEWAEGAHLEPDERHGYAYLNAVGRALAGHSFFGAQPDPSIRFVTRFRSGLFEELERRPFTAALFVHGLRANLSSSGLLLHADDLPAKAFFERNGLAFELSLHQDDTTTLHVEQAVFLPPNALATLAAHARRFAGYRVVANHKNDPDLFSNHANLCATAPEGFAPALWAETPSGVALGDKVAAQAFCYRIEVEHPDPWEVTPWRVSTLVRFHRSGALHELSNALWSLLVHTRSNVEVVLLAQDLDSEQRVALEELLQAMPIGVNRHHIRVQHFTSDDTVKDLRCVMLNQGVALASNRYVTFLDYDDTLFPGALTQLAWRLDMTGARATFGRVYHADLDDRTGLVQERRINHGYGSSYSDFYQDNCAPIHSFMLDKSRIDLGAIRYFPDMKFMEDYYFLLQVLDRENCDWASLKEPVFVGDYNFRVSGENHTLVFRNEEDRKRILDDVHYQVCQGRIDEMRVQVRLKRLTALGQLDAQPKLLSAVQGSFE